MGGQDSFVASLYAAILAQAAGGAQDGSTHTVLAWPGIPINPQEYGNIWASDNQNGSPEALEGFSSLVDGALPLMSTVYEPGVTALETVYSMILNAVVPPGETAVAKAFDEAAAKFAAVVRGSLANAEAQFHPSLPRPRNWCDPSGDSLWTTMTIGQDASLPTFGAGEAPSHPAPLPPEVHAMLVHEGLPMWRIVHPPGTPVAKPSTTPPNGTVHPAAAAPTIAVRILPNVIALRQNAKLLAGTLRPAAPMPTVTSHLVTPIRVPIFRSVPQPAHAAPAPAPPAHAAPAPAPPAHAAPAPAPPAHAAPAPALPTQEHPLGATQLGTSFRYLRVNIERAWLNPLLFRLAGWSLGGIPAGTFSNGATETNPGVFPLLPIGFVAVRDVKISGNWTDADKARAQAATSGGVSAAFGPFTLGAGGAIHAGFDGSTLTVPGIQIIAWICSPVPMLPPT